ncbi:sulfite exporter TauE/SafE family protein [Anaerotardibacter muris]|uniref:sulfite exporter TauE/SafE family protein n=1 Tax=Anaerotardibacter muris TaxID=2941505 RepID=UPI002041F8E8|nr:sulfite exporter TauE/SafE family protein [Anaerotardibacter muris]
MLEQFVIAIVIGLIVGLFSGLLGIGGGTLMIPVFRLGFGMSAIASTATSLFTIVPTSIAGCVTHIKNGTCIVKLGLAAGIAGAITSPLGVLAATNSPDIAIMACAAIIIAYSAFTMFKKAISMPKNSHSELSTHATLQRFRAAFEDEADREIDLLKKQKEQEALAAERKRLLAEERKRFGAKQLAKGSAIGLVAGFASGYVGVGGGFLMVPLFISLLGITMKQASGTSLIAVVLLAIPGVITQSLHGNVDYIAGVAMAIGSIPGAIIGASLIRYIPERKMRFLFGFFLLFAAIILIGNEIGVFGF